MLTKIANRSAAAGNRGPRSKLAACLVALFLTPGTSFALESGALTEVAKISALLDRVGNADLTFIRNGTAYSARQAREHMELKLSKSRGRIKTADQFIRLIGSRSSFSGQPYQVRFKDGRTVTSEAYLRRLLAEITGEHAKRSKTPER